MASVQDIVMTASEHTAAPPQPAAVTLAPAQQPPAHPAVVRPTAPAEIQPDTVLHVQLAQSDFSPPAGTTAVSFAIPSGSDIDQICFAVNRHLRCPSDSPLTALPHSFSITRFDVSFRYNMAILFIDSSRVDDLPGTLRLPHHRFTTPRLCPLKPTVEYCLTGFLIAEPRYMPSITYTQLHKPFARFHREVRFSFPTKKSNKILFRIICKDLDDLFNISTARRRLNLKIGNPTSSDTHAFAVEKASLRLAPDHRALIASHKVIYLKSTTNPDTSWFSDNGLPLLNALTDPLPPPENLPDMIGLTETWVSSQPSPITPLLRLLRAYSPNLRYHLFDDRRDDFSGVRGLGTAILIHHRWAPFIGAVERIPGLLTGICLNRHHANQKIWFICVYNPHDKPGRDLVTAKINVIRNSLGPHDLLTVFGDLNAAPDPAVDRSPPKLHSRRERNLPAIMNHSDPLTPFRTLTGTFHFLHPNELAFTHHQPNPQTHSRIDLIIDLLPDCPAHKKGKRRHEIYSMSEHDYAPPSLAHSASAVFMTVLLSRSRTVPSRPAGVSVTTRPSLAGPIAAESQMRPSETSASSSVPSERPLVAQTPQGEAAAVADGGLRRNRTLPSRVALLQSFVGSPRSEKMSPAGTPGASQSPSLMSALGLRPERPLQPYATKPYPSAPSIAPSTTSTNSIGASTMDRSANPSKDTMRSGRIHMGSHAVSPQRRDTLAAHEVQVLSNPVSTPSVHITAVNFVSPVSSPSLASPHSSVSNSTHPTSPPRVDVRSLESGQGLVWRDNYRKNATDSFTLRAFSHKAIAFQRRQWFTNICCVTLCPFLMIMVAFVLKSVITSLSNSSGSFQILYCSDQLSINEQNWPIFNLSSYGITVTSGSTVPNANPNMPVKHANYFTRASLVDLSSRDVFSQLTSTTVAGSMPCTQWFGQMYPYNDSSVYERLPRTSTHPEYAFKDSLYASELNSGWLDVLQPIINGDSVAKQQQALSLVRSFAAYQMRPWAIVTLDPKVNATLIGTAPKQAALTSLSSIPNYVLNTGANASGMLDTIEPRYAIDISVSPLALKGAQKVPFFNFTGFTKQSQMDAYFESAIRNAVADLASVDSSALRSGMTDLQYASLLASVRSALNNVPYAGIVFNKIDHTNKDYAYVLQIGTDQRLARTPGFPLAGLRMLLQQAQLSNAIVRFSSQALQNAVITQGIRSLPQLGSSTFDIPFGSIIGRVLYPLGISFLIPIFTISLVRDKESRVVTMLRMNGLGSPFAYYLAEYVTFFATSIVSTAIFWGCGAATSLELFSRTEWSVLLILLVLWSNVQVTLAMFFNAISRQSRIALIFVFLIVVCGVVTAFILDQVFPNPGDYPLGLFVWPPLAFYRALGTLNNAATSSLRVPYTLSMLKPGDEVFSAIVALVVEIFVYLVLSVYLANVVPSEFGTNLPWHYPVSSLFGQRKKDSAVGAAVLDRKSPVLGSKDDAGGDDDVREERERVLSGDVDPTAPLVMRRMAKQYVSDAGERKLAVRDVTLAVDTGTVFGLLGPNGAGKTTLISILTGVYEPTHGSATLGGFDIVGEADAAFRSIGVCPQFDILWPDLTIEEHLFFYARLKGVAREFEREAVAAATELVKLETMRTRRVKNLSGGEKRRLSIAIALVADPRVVFLDEPTTGLDPEVRRVVWDVIARARGSRAILMTTHSMEEAEVCCQRIGIMAKGTMRCLGTAARLKELYGRGYKLHIYGASAQLDQAERFVQQVLPRGRASRIQMFNNMRVYVFQPTQEELANVFDAMSREHRRHGILSWGIGQTTLDEIFTSLISEDDA
ncbi:hypothetical protein HK105_204591 [Polyrhizophydium stewartii]|uniref:ABC transporter domain-containing protein n=1 Tax=Polyrhizophydium stewartii TaxID=2732419 RepID=A0ABR4N8Q7_9FUNG